MKMTVFCGYVILLCIVAVCIATEDLKTNEHQVVANNKNFKSDGDKTPTTNRVDSDTALHKDINSVSAPNGSASKYKMTKASNLSTTIEMSTTASEVTTVSSPPVERVNPVMRNISTGAVVRGFYVFVGLGAIVVMYIVVRTIRLKRKKTTVRKYGVLANREDVEMTPLGADDEEEESTLFDMTKSLP